MKVLITGARGFVGKHLTEYLGVDNEILATARRKDLDNIEYLDLSSDKSVTSFIESHVNDDIEAVVHTAAVFADAQMTFDEQMQVYEQNVGIARNMVKLIQGIGIKVLINLSTMAVYPNEDGEYSEKSEVRMSVNSECFYGLSKFVAENIFSFALSKDVRIVHLRLAQIYGRGMRNDRIIPTMINGLKRENRIIVFGDGKRTSNFVPIEKVCEVIKSILADRSIHGIYNIGNVNISYLELAMTIKEKYGNKDTQIVLKEQGSKARFVLNTDKWDKYWRLRDVL
ncbi:MAG: NAD(P)-dependent oxidoreductase [Lachnospiraceae bacterium]|nr:NAD(P)-dependent oxidoreductase [Lachnospiraceae bacterium]